MLFFRSEERVREWCAAHGYPMRPLVTMDQLWTLATTWYSTRFTRGLAAAAAWWDAFHFRRPWLRRRLLESAAG